MRTLEKRLVGIMDKFPAGLGITALLAQLQPAPSAKTVVRHLNQLIKVGRVQRQGRGKNTTYKLIGDDVSESMRIKEYLQQPFEQRKAASYQRDFLFDYVPNESYYLPAKTIKHLEELGTEFNQPQPAGTFARKILDRLLVDLSWNSSRLEGNTYSLLETQRLLQDGEVAGGKNLFETRMILNHKATIEFLLELGEDLSFTKYVILNVHALLANNLLGDPGAPGRLREAPVGIGRTRYQSLAIPQLIHEYFERILQTAHAIENPFEQSFFAMVHLPYLQPFIDVNKRVSRMAANIPLINNNLCPLSFVGVAKQDYIDGILGVDELNKVDLLRDVYVAAYTQSAKRYSEAQAVLGEPDWFREKYHDDIVSAVFYVVSHQLNKKHAIDYVNKIAHQAIVAKDQAHFIEVVDSELMALHIGNIARYKIKPELFESWQKIW